LRYCELVLPVEPVEPAGACCDESGAEVLPAVLPAVLGVLSVLRSLDLAPESSDAGGVLALDGALSEPALALPEEVLTEGAASEPVEDEGAEVCPEADGVDVVALESLEDVDGLAVSPAKAALETSAKATAM
jgi:hypothetical protein